MNDTWSEGCLLSPSLICLNMLELRKQIQEFELSGVKMLHIDILDGHFSPSMPLGFETVRQVRKETSLLMECHVMADPPEYFVDELINIGVDQIVFHLETASHVDGLITKIHNSGIRAGVALKPATPLTELEYIIEKCDAVLIMQINPGYASNKGESKIQYVNRKIQDLHELIEKKKLNTKVILDGRVSLDDVSLYGNREVNIFVGGTTCIDRNNIPLSVAKFEEVRNKFMPFSTRKEDAFYINGALQ